MLEFSLLKSQLLKTVFCGWTTISITFKQLVHSQYFSSRSQFLRIKESKQGVNSQMVN